MTIHSRSLVEFGQLLNGLTACMADGGPVAGALTLVRDYFAASAVLLRVDLPGKPSAVHADEGCEFLRSADGSVDFRATLQDLGDRYANVTANEVGEGDRNSFTLWLFRERASLRLDNEQTASAGVLLAQIARTYELAARLDTKRIENALYSDVLDKLGIGVVLLDANGRVDRASAVAQRFLDASDGLQVHAGRLRAASASEDKALQGAIRAVTEAADCAAASRGVSLTKRSGARTLGLMIRPAGATGATVRYAVYIRDCDAAPEVENDFVRQIFDLTPAEAAVTNRLTAGLSLEDAANSLHISRNTARAHLRSIFSKSGITRQTELVRLVLNSAVLLGERPSQAA